MYNLFQEKDGKEGYVSQSTGMAEALAEKTGLPLVHLDSLYWKDNWESVGREVFDARLEQELVKPKWILDGNMNRTLPHRLEYCDTVFYLDFSSISCLIGVISRTIKFYGKTRPDMGPNCPERISLGFYKEAFLYNKEMECILNKFFAEKLKKFKICIIIFHTILWDSD